MNTAPPPTTLIARRMKAARQLLGLSQMELGLRAGIDASSASARINQYERGKHVPDILTVSHLAKVLCVPAAYFYAEEDSLAELINLFGKLKASDRKLLLTYLETLVKK